MNLPFGEVLFEGGQKAELYPPFVFFFFFGGGGLNGEWQMPGRTPEDAKEPTWVKHLLLCGDSAHAGREPDLAAQEVPGLSPHHPMLLEANESQRKALLEAAGGRDPDLGFGCGSIFSSFFLGRGCAGFGPCFHFG